MACAPRLRGKPSGLPFLAQFTDVAQQAGLRQPIVAGHTDRCDYIIETMSCGCALFDYRQRWLARHPDADGFAFWRSACRCLQSPLPEQSRRTFKDVTKEADLFRTGYFYGVTMGDFNNDGHEDLFLTGWPQNVLYRNNGDGTFTDITKARA